MPPKDINCSEKELVTFTSELNKPKVEVTWLCNGKPVEPSAVFEMRSDKKVHYLTILSTSVDHAGEYTVQAADKTATAKLVVDGEL